MPDAELLTALKQAKTKKMFFAFIPKGGGDGKLIISKAKIPAKVVAGAKKEIGGGNPVTGKCIGGGGSTMVFQVVKAAPPALAAAVKKVVKRDTGLGIDPEFQLAADADADEADTGAPAAAAIAPAATPAAAATPPAAPPAAPPAGGNVLGIQKALQKLGYDPGKIDGLMGPNTQAAIKKFQQASGLAADGIVGSKTQAALAKALQGGAAPAGGAPAAAASQATAAGQSPPAAAASPPTKGDRHPVPDSLNLGPWQAARQNAINDLKALAGKVAGTKHGSAAGVVKEIQTIISKLPASPAPKDLDKLEEFVRKDQTITDAENIPSHFHDLDIREPLLKALETMRT